MSGDQKSIALMMSHATCVCAVFAKQTTPRQHECVQGAGGGAGGEAGGAPGSTSTLYCVGPLGSGC